MQRIVLYVMSFDLNSKRVKNGYNCNPKRVVDTSCVIMVKQQLTLYVAACAVSLLVLDSDSEQ